MNKRILLVLIGILAVVLIAIGIIYFSATRSGTVSAQFHYINGEIYVNQQKVVGDMKLEESDVIETKESGEASVILYESVIIRLKPNTKISISDLNRENPSIYQESGETWNKFTKLSGVEGYSVGAGSTVASVRGTLFKFGINKIITGEGKVDYEINGQNYEVNENEVVENSNGSVRKRTAEASEISEIKDELQKSIDELKYLRKKEIDKHPIIVNVIKKRFNLTDERIESGLREADLGNTDINELKNKSPVKIESIDKIADITKKITEMNIKLGVFKNISL